MSTTNKQQLINKTSGQQSPHAKHVASGAQQDVSQTAQ
jgi:hypothetical protein